MRFTGIIIIDKASVLGQDSYYNSVQSQVPGGVRQEQGTAVVRGLVVLGGLSADEPMPVCRWGRCRASWVLSACQPGEVGVTFQHVILSAKPSVDEAC